MTTSISCNYLSKAPFAFAVHEFLAETPSAELNFSTIDANPGYRHLLGLSQTDTIESDSLFTLESVFANRDRWLQIFYRAAYEGAVHDQEYYSLEMDCWLHIHVYQLAKGCFATMFTPLNTASGRFYEAQQLFDINPDLVCLIDSDNKFIKINPALAKLLGGNASELTSRNFFDYVMPEDVENSYQELNQVRDADSAYRFLNRMITADNQICYLEWNAIADSSYIYAISRNITERFEQQEKLEQLAIEKDIIFNSGRTAMFLVQAGNDGKMRYVRDNLANQRLLAPICENVTGKTAIEVFGQEQGSMIDKFYNRCLEEVKPIEFDLNLKLSSDPEAAVKYLQISLTPVFYEQNTIFIVGSVVDLTQEKETQQRISFLSFHDQLTGLYNRHFYEEEVRRLDRSRNIPLAVIQADVNGLKLTNDAFGHTVGDLLIQAAAGVLKDACRADDIVARLGGDEFIVLLPKTDRDGVQAIVERMREKINGTNVEAVPLSISLGYAVKEDSREDIADVMKKAEDFMYRRKLSESPQMRSQTVNNVLSTLHNNSSRELKHSKNVARLVVELGRSCGLPDAELSDLKTLGMLHDIGKIGISLETLNKTEPLTDNDWLDIKKHPEVGYRILSTVNDLAEIADFVLAHHENWDGSGYPRRISGNEIPFQSRILALADAYDAMTNPHSYKRAMTEEEAIAEIRANAGKQFDPELSELFIQTIRNSVAL